jgi:hypothetical protein
MLEKISAQSTRPLKKKDLVFLEKSRFAQPTFFKR